MSGKTLTLGLLSVAAVSVAYGPLLLEFGQGLWETPHYQHYPFVLLAAGLLFVQRLSVGEAEEPTPRRWPIYAAYAFAWVTLAAAYYVYSPLLGAISFVVLLGGWGASLSAGLGRRFPWGPWLLLWLVVPPPLNFDRQLMQKLQQSSSLLSSYTLDTMGVDHLMDGNALVLPDKQLFIDEACSGIISVVSIVACAAMYGVWRRRGTLATLLLICMAAGWAALLNVVRIVTIALAWINWGIDWSEGASHTVLGLVIFGLSLVVLVATDWLLKAVLAEIEPRWDELTAEPLNYGKPLVALWDWFAAPDADSESATGYAPIHWRHLGLNVAAVSLGLAPAIAFAGLGAAHVAASLTQPGDESAASVVVDRDSLAERLQKDVMPDELLGLRLASVEHHNRSADSNFGEHSVVFEYVSQNNEHYLVSCDFLFRGDWHDLFVCYEGIGWRVNDQAVQAAEQGGDEGVPYDRVEIDLSKPDGSNAFVVYSESYLNGEPVVAPKGTLLDRVFRALSRKSLRSDRRPFVQTQVLAESRLQITPKDRETSRKLLAEAQSRFTSVAKSFE